ncbi:MAG: hypothetical protein GX660_15625 [Clostridiaceae bacterium]|nr:hypothetical protein [Clostridiaceae bacterium]
MADDIKKMKELSDEQLMEIAGGYEGSAISGEIIIRPYYGIVVKDPCIPIAKYGVQPLYGIIPLYGIKPPYIKP